MSRRRARTGVLRNLTTCENLSTLVRRAANPLERLVGALRYRTMAPSEGIWIEPCSAIHTLGMRAAIDVIVLDTARTVVAVHADVRPNRPLVGHRRGRAVLEMGAGFLAAARIAVGDRLTLDETNHAFDTRRHSEETAC